MKKIRGDLKNPELRIALLPGVLNRFILFLLLLLGALSSSTARADIPSICEGRNFGTCLKWLLLARCGSYGKWNPFIGHEVICETSVVEMMKRVEAKQPKGEVTVIAFPTRMNQLLRDRATLNYLWDLPRTLEKSIAAGETFRLWDYTLAKARGDELRALEWIAIFFQDTFTNPEPIALEYATVGSRPLSARERDVWWKAIQAISIERLSDIADPAAILVRAYPGIDASELNKGFYHFYFSAYVARKLKSVPTLGKRMEETGMAAFAPFLLNLIYETAELDESRSPLHDPAPFPASKRYKLADIYAGYLGGLFGLGGAPLVAKAIDFETFSARMATDPRGMTLSLYENFLPAETTPTVPVTKESPHERP